MEQETSFDSLKELNGELCQLEIQSYVNKVFSIIQAIQGAVILKTFGDKILDTHCIDSLCFESFLNPERRALLQENPDYEQVCKYLEEPIIKKFMEAVQSSDPKVEELFDLARRAHEFLNTDPHVLELQEYFNDEAYGCLDCLSECTRDEEGCFEDISEATFSDDGRDDREFKDCEKDLES